MGVAAPIQRDPIAHPEQRLVAAIISRAWLDMCGASDSEAWPAISFLTDRHGSHARWRNELLDGMNLDGDILAQRVRKFLDGDMPMPTGYQDPDAPTTQASIKKQSERARSRWKHLKDRSRTT